MLYLQFTFFIPSYIGLFFLTAEMCDDSHCQCHKISGWRQLWNSFRTANDSVSNKLRQPSFQIPCTRTRIMFAFWKGDKTCCRRWERNLTDAVVGSSSTVCGSQMWMWGNGNILLRLVIYILYATRFLDKEFYAYFSSLLSYSGMLIFRLATDGVCFGFRMQRYFFIIRW